MFVGRSSSWRQVADDLPVAENAVEVLKRTEEMANDHYHHMIQPIHVLTALVGVPSDIAEILANHGVREEAVMALLGEGVP
jgi:ATP-dependent Clp protease ATP-binding subunit ClpA